MGCSSSTAAVNSPVPSEVDKQLADMAEADKLHFKILLLGAGESGKSTVLKQIKLIYKGSVSNKDKQQCTNAIRRNAVECMQVILNAMPQLNIDFPTDESDPSVEARKRILALEEDSEFTVGVADDIVTLWAHPTVRSAYEQRELYWLLDGAQYYFEEVHRLAEADFEPTEEDIIMTRVRTTGIDNTEISEPPYTYTVVDVGGQRNERRKWIHCFDNVKAVVFLVGLSGYNQRLFEDSQVNKMQESIKLFGQVASNPLFRDTPIFVFLNKKDLFESMIHHTPLTVCFPEYSGPEKDVHAALAYIEHQYRALMEKACPGKRLFVHVVAARVRMDMKVAWGDVKDQLKSIYDPKNKAGVWTKVV